LYAEFRSISANDLGMVAVNRRTESVAEETDQAVNERELLTRLTALTERQRSEGLWPVAVAPSDDHKEPSWHVGSILRLIHQCLCSSKFRHASAALLLCLLVGLAGYRLREKQLSPAITELNTEMAKWKTQAEIAAEKQQSDSARLRKDQRDQEDSRKLLNDVQARYTALLKQQKDLESQVAAARAELDQKARDLEAARTAIAERTKDLVELQSRLQFAMERTEQERRNADSLKSRLDLADHAARTHLAEGRGFSEAESKSLFGARDLHIVDVYDVDSSGKTKRTYGRVYYAEKRLLIFYAFDLEDKQRNRAPAGFQAWGYSQPNESKPQNLGMFTMEDPTINRWVLEVDNPKVLEHIDAVFVTLESPSGSPSPRGRRLLYANLATPPNHP
jgi:hypothetical protein